ncbi:THAP domain-containing protein 2-like [Polyergus mexicanus]|uniref:THAP domain-containing protein 2-like n=1 Tax=Polyergus mexicanus TaxID=615972 RepID=UPI0038B64F8F
MGRYCFVKLCTTTKYKAKEVKHLTSVSFYKFPSNPEVQKKWVQALITLNGKESTLNLSKTAMICAKHFEESCFEKIGLSCVRLKPHSIPTIFPRAENESVEMQSSDNCRKDIEQEQSLQMMDVSSIPNEVPVQTVNVQRDILTIPLSKILSTLKKKENPMVISPITY